MTVADFEKEFVNAFNREKQLTQECRQDLCRYLEHDTSLTRLQLAQVLQLRIQAIITEVLLDKLNDVDDS